jgi:hypothetical protein
MIRCCRWWPVSCFSSTAARIWKTLSTDLLNRFRTERLIEGARLNTLYALQRAVAELGFCDPPHHRIGAHSPRATGGAAIWEQWADRWHATLDRMTVGDYVQRTAGLGDRIGKPLEAPSKERQLAALRRFFSDCQEWEWLPRRFDPRRALATPRSIAALLGPNPRMIADDIWAKLLWAGLNLQTGDLPVTTCGAAERRVPAGG